MTALKCTTIPRSFSWIIPAQSLVTGVAMYSTVFVFHVGSKPFIFAVVAAGLQFLLGLYCCIMANRPGIHHAIAIPILLGGIAGVWCAPVYYFSKAASLWLKLLGPGSEGETPPAAKWSYVGLAMTCLAVIIPLTLLAIFLIEGLRNPRIVTVPYMTGIHAPAHATLQGLCQYVWTAQWERKEDERLSAAEMASFQAVNWDLGFAKTASERAASFLSGGFGLRQGA